MRRSVRALAQDPPNPGNSVAIAQILRAWDETWNGNVEDIPAILIPWPIAYLVLRKAWTNIVACTRWHSGYVFEGPRAHLPGPIPSWPPENTSCWFNMGNNELQPQAQEEGGEDKHPFTSARLLELTRHFRRWAPRILQDANPTDRADLQSCVATLEHWRQGLDAVAGIGPYPGMSDGSRFRHSSRKLLKCLRMLPLLKGSADALAEVVTQSLSLTLPDYMRNAFIESANAPVNKLPHTSLLQRYELSLDIAMMLVARGVHALFGQSSVRFELSDSTSIGGIDWIWSQFKSIDIHNLQEAFDAMVALSRAVNNECERRAAIEAETGDVAIDTHIPLDSWKPWLSSIQRTIVEHVNPPAAMGSGGRSLQDKCIAEVHKWTLQLPPSTSILEHSSTYCAHCGDLGTEMGVPDFETSDHNKLLAPWMNRNPIVADVGEGDHEADVRLDAEVGDLELDDGELLGEPSAFDVDANDEGAADGAAVGNANPEPPSPSITNVLPEPEPHNGLFYFMFNATLIAGLQHIIYNMTEDVHTAMLYWKRFYEQLKNFEALLRMEERRKRFRWTCMAGTVHEIFEHLFKKWSASLYEGRWREVVNFVRELLAIYHVLCAAWDEGKYVRGVDILGRERPGNQQVQEQHEASLQLTQFKPRMLTESLKSATFFLFLNMASKVDGVTRRLSQETEMCVCHAPLVKHLNQYYRGCGSLLCF